MNVHTPSKGSQRRLPVEAQLEGRQKMIEARLQRIDQQADEYIKWYPEQMRILEKSDLSKVRSIGSYDIWALGKMLEQFDTYRMIVEDDGNTALLGKIPNVAYDVIAVTYGASIIPIIASVQPIEEEQGMVYFKQVIAAQTKGTQTQNQVLVDPRQLDVTPQGYAGSELTVTLVTSTTNSTVTYSGTLSVFPVRAQSIKIASTAQFASQNITGVDDGNGNILGFGIAGTINYLTGVWSLTFTTNPGGGKNIVITYQQNYELASTIPQMMQAWQAQQVFAKIFALRGTFGLLQSFAMRKRLGVIAEDELANDLVSEINAEIGGLLILKLLAAAAGQPAFATFSRTPPTNTSLAEHYLSFKIQLAVAEANLVNQAGRGTISCLIGDKQACAVVSVLPGFQKITDGNTLGAHLFGTLDGIPIIRVNDPNILSSTPNPQFICIWKGPSPWEGPAVFSPYMPLVVTATLQNVANPLLNTRAAAVWAGADVLVPNFATLLKVT